MLRRLHLQQVHQPNHQKEDIALGQCLPFDDSADGLVVGEGGGALVLKKLSKAQADGDKIYGLIRGTGTSCDGQDGGLLAPSHAGQVRALEEAYRVSGVNPSQVRFVECHDIQQNEPEMD